MRCVLVSHTHWDREWHHPFQAFRARLVDAVDHVLDLIARDPGYYFLLDGQTIVLEDYLEIRPSRREELAAAIGAGRLGIGPWYVQPDSLIPGGETHVRNLLEGRRVGSALGPVSTVAYTPDSFGHPATFPALLRGFGLEGFVYWRGNGNEIVDLGANYEWVAPDDTRMLACNLSYGYFSASGFGENPEPAVEHLKMLGQKLAQFSGGDQVLFMNGSDHMLPDAATRSVAETLEKETGWTVERALLDAYVDAVPREGLPEFRGELVGGRLANLLPGVWSTRTYLKLRNRRCEALLGGWAEPFTALSRILGGPDEQPSLREAWRWVLPNQAHDSICGCSHDRVHEQMLYRYDAAEELASETTRRALERIAGLPATRHTPWTASPELAVFNPSPHPRSDVVRFPLEPWPHLMPGSSEHPGVHPLLLANAQAEGLTADGAAVRFVPADDENRARLDPDRPVHDIEFVVHDVPAFGWRRVRLERSERREPDRVDAGREIAAGRENKAGSVRVRANDDGTLDVTLGEREFRGLCALEDLGDRGDSYDFDPVDGGQVEGPVRVSRARHSNGIQELEIERTLRIPTKLADDRHERAAETCALRIVIRARVAPETERVDLRVRVDNQASDHRLRLLFPTGASVDEFEAASTFDVATRTPGRREAERWRHPAPDTFLHQGFVAANGLCIAAPGLREAEVTASGTVAITLLRAVGWLSRDDLDSRPGHAGPAVPTPGAQCLGPLSADLALFSGVDARAASAAELGLRAVAAGPDALAAEGRALLSVEPHVVVVSALKPAEAGDGSVLRLHNPSDQTVDAQIQLGFPVASAQNVRLDETPQGEPESIEGETLARTIPPRALLSILLR